jgi:enamine deaminase RidA (YjgF/YER057c/UK114 family)
MSFSVEEKLNQLGIVIPEAPKPLAAYVPSIKIENFVFTSGQLPIKDGQLLFKGKVDETVSIEQAKEAAKICAINCLSAVKNSISSLDNIEQIVKVVVFVASTPTFTQQPAVANGASEFLLEIFGENGKHARSAVGVAALPLDAPVEIEMICKIK